MVPSQIGCPVCRDEMGVDVRDLESRSEVTKVNRSEVRLPFAMDEAFLASQAERLRVFEMQKQKGGVITEPTACSGKPESDGCVGGDCHVQVGADDDAEVTSQEQHEAAAGDVVTHAEKTFEADAESGERTESQVAVPLQNEDSLVHCEGCEDTSHLHLASVRRSCRGRGWKEHFKTYDARKRDGFAFDRRVTSSRAGDARNAGGGVCGKSYFLLGLESNADSSAKSAFDSSPSRK